MDRVTFAVAVVTVLVMALVAALTVGVIPL